MPEVWQQALRFARKAIESGRRARSRKAWRAPNPMKYLATLTVIDTTTLEPRSACIEKDATSECCMLLDDPAVFISERESPNSDIRAHRKTSRPSDHHPILRPFQFSLFGMSRAYLRRVIRMLYVVPI